MEAQAGEVKRLPSMSWGAGNQTAKGRTILVWQQDGALQRLSLRFFHLTPFLSLWYLLIAQLVCPEAQHSREANLAARKLFFQSVVNLDTQWMGRTVAGTGTVRSRVKAFSESLPRLPHLSHNLWLP